MLAQLKSVKSMGLSSAFSKFIEEKRDAEIVASLQERYTRLWVYGFGEQFLFQYPKQLLIKMNRCGQLYSNTGNCVCWCLLLDSCR